MQHLVATACDAAQAVASACAHVSPFPPGSAPSIEQYNTQVNQAAHNLIVSYLEVGPVAWLSLVVVGWVVWRAVVGKVGTALLMYLLPARKESTYVVVRGTPKRRKVAK